MNNTYYNKDIFPQTQYNNESIEQIPINQSYKQNNQTNEPFMNNIIKTNIGKKVKIYLSFPNLETQTEFNGIIEQAGNDYIILSEPSTGNWKILPLIYLNYITYEEKIN